MICYTCWFAEDKSVVEKLAYDNNKVQPQTLRRNHQKSQVNTVQPNQVAKVQPTQAVSSSKRQEPSKLSRGQPRPVNTVQRSSQHELARVDGRKRKTMELAEFIAESSDSEGERAPKRRRYGNVGGDDSDDETYVPSN